MATNFNLKKVLASVTLGIIITITLFYVSFVRSDSNSLRLFFFWPIRLIEKTFPGIGYDGGISQAGFLCGLMISFAIYTMLAYSLLVLLKKVIENGKSNAVNWVDRSAIWALIFGMVGFLSGVIGPMIFNPGKQDPLLEIFVTGQTAFLAGGLFGAISAFNKLTTRQNLYALIVCSVFVIGFTINSSMPEPRYRGAVVDAEILYCRSPEPDADAAVARWDRATWTASNQPRAQWRTDVPDMLKRDKGVILQVHVFRKKKFYENRKPWNKGQLAATEWAGENMYKTYYVRGSDASCADYKNETRRFGAPSPLKTRRLYSPSWEAPPVSPPDTLPAFLGLSVLGPIPQKYQRIIK